MSKTNTVGTHKTATYTDSDGSLCVKYHNCVVWRRAPDGTVRLHSDGWLTRTTKLRMNQAFNQFGMSGFGVFQEKGDWYVRVPSDAPGIVRDYADGMEVKEIK